MSEVAQELIDLVVENKDQDDNALLGLMIGSGLVVFNKARTTLNTILVEQGLRMTKAQRDEKAAEILEDFGVTDETTAEDVAEQVEILVDELDIKPAAAKAYIRGVFDSEEIEMPKVKRGSSGPRAAKTPGFRGDVKIAADYAIQNPVPVENDKEVFKEFMDANGSSTTKSGKDKSGTWYASVEDLRIFGSQWSEANS